MLHATSVQTHSSTLGNLRVQYNHDLVREQLRSSSNVVERLMCFSDTLEILHRYKDKAFQY